MLEVEPQLQYTAVDHDENKPHPPCAAVGAEGTKVPPYYQFGEHMYCTLLVAVESRRRLLFCKEKNTKQYTY
jgi:hypothetical protein